MVLETDRDFLEGSVSGVESWKLTTTYDDNVNNGLSNRERAKASKTTEGSGTLVDGDDELGANGSGAHIVMAVAKLGNDAVALVAEVVEDVDDVGIGSLRYDLWYRAGKRHGTGGEDSEDGREAHDEET